MMAAKHDIGVEVLFSHSTDHYIRAYAAVRYGARLADKSVQMMGYVLHCFSCFHRETSSGIFMPLKRDCAECGAKLKVAGPLWLGRTADESFCFLMKREVDERRLRQKRRILKLISLVRDEAEAPLMYYVIDKICDKLNLSIPPLTRIIDGVRRAGFQVVLTHFNSRGIKTNAPANVVKEVIKRISLQEHYNRS